MKWQIKSSKNIVKDRWISLRSDECILPNGKLIEPYYVLEYSNWVNIVPITKNNEIVMIRQYRHGINDTILELPCGSIEPYDKSPLEAVKENYWKKLVSEVIISINYVNYPLTRQIILIFLLALLR
jgi:hypothetical protein